MNRILLSVFILLAAASGWAQQIPPAPYRLWNHYLPPAAGGTPPGNAWTFVQSTNVAASSCVLQNVTAGNLLVVFYKWENSGTLGYITNDVGGGLAVSNNIVHHSNSDVHVSCYHYLSAPASGNNGFVAGGGTGSRTFPGITVYEFSATGTHAYDTGANGTNVSTSVSAGPFTTATLNGVTAAAYGKYSAATPSSFAVGGNSATQNPTSFSELGTWYYLNSAQLSSASSTCTLSSSSAWPAVSASFKSQ